VPDAIFDGTDRAAPRRYDPTNGLYNPRGDRHHSGLSVARAIPTD